MELNNQQKIDLISLSLKSAIEIYSIENINNPGRVLNIDTKAIPKGMTPEKLSEVLSVYSGVRIVPLENEEVSTIGEILANTNEIYKSLKNSL